jgi:hypothetical protein
VRKCVQCLPSSSVHFQALDARISPANVAETADDNGTTITEPECHGTVAADGEPSVLKAGARTLTDGRLSVRNRDTDQRPFYRLHKSLDDVPLVNITDSVICPVKKSTSVSAEDVGTADIYSINVNLQKSILIPLKIQVSVHWACSMHVPALDEHNYLSCEVRRGKEDRCKTVTGGVRIL